MSLEGFGEFSVFLLHILIHVSIHVSIEMAKIRPESCPWEKSTHVSIHAFHVSIHHNVLIHVSIHVSIEMAKNQPESFPWENPFMYRYILSMYRYMPSKIQKISFMYRYMKVMYRYIEAVENFKKYREFKFAAGDGGFRSYNVSKHYEVVYRLYTHHFGTFRR